MDESSYAILVTSLYVNVSLFIYDRKKPLFFFSLLVMLI
ncbi:hypothetical protein BACI71_110635 [Bacillus mycoides]|uniref:Uncharacterized protein n=1 Tax=Bacillus mycoides TaxID=1405 RepID=A0A653R4S7_BACMY|nr:hypothetical protein BACI71_110635 [Bacillus mycoides]